MDAWSSICNVLVFDTLKQHIYNSTIDSFMNVFILKPLAYEIRDRVLGMQNKALRVHESLTLSILNLPLASSSTTSRESLSRFSTCRG